MQGALQSVVIIIIAHSAEAPLYACIMQKAMQFSAPAKNSNEQTGSDFQQNLQKVKNEDGTKVGRNDPCPCKSGKKFKKCCGS